MDKQTSTGEAEVPLSAAHKAGAVVKENDPDESKGAVEDDAPARGNESNTSMNGQMGHRNKPEEMGDSDSDYPEPDASGEHTGQKK
jgi:hypothetical protein